ncbi:amidohydrolase family protein [Pleionea sp. CnH1-48]|uniref:amidohydrolase family protein n=1 Tax=Pleionea sp. CnH1-48 TaxID=2954494 RepID=UPI0020973C0D|nr:amidohydrolase family protein [Pleionea sp. CnH1-48]MCO7225355.1 amidohydrolase family protein [Pleionea sp. CnH1-48]
MVKEKLRRKVKRLLSLVLSMIVFPAITHASGDKSNKPIDSPITAFTHANILEPSVELPILNATILVAEGKILKIQPHSAPIPHRANVKELGGKWVIPGLIDGHVHLAQSGGAFTRPDVIDATKIVPYKEEQTWLLNNQEEILKEYVKLGITSIVDLGGPSEYTSQYKSFSMNAELPQIYFSGPLLSPMEMPQLNANGFTFLQVKNKEEAVNAVYQQLKLGAHILKVVWSQETGLSSQQLADLYKPAIKIAKDNKLVVAIHVEELDNAKKAVEVGADILVHGALKEHVDNELISLMRKHDVTYMPTLTAYQHYFEFFKGTLSFSQFEQMHSVDEVIQSFEELSKNQSKADQMFQIFLKYMPYVDEHEDVISNLTQQEQGIVSQLRKVFSSKYLDIQKQNLKKLVESSVKVSLGTDAGNIGTLHASSLLGEVEAWQAAGVSNKDILKAITSGNASAFHLDKVIGSISTGKQADFVVLEANPYEDITTLSQPVLVVKNGVPVFSREQKDRQP